jgi:PAS domain S-box-containing protein
VRFCTSAAAIQESEQRFREMTEHAPVMIWMSDLGGHCVHINKQLRQFWGVRDGSLDGFDWSTMLHPEDDPMLPAKPARR